MTEQARVVLKKAKSYTVGSRRFLQDVPQIIRGEEEIQKYETNAHFHVKRLPPGKIDDAAASKAGKRFVRRGGGDAGLEA